MSISSHNCMNVLNAQISLASVSPQIIESHMKAHPTRCYKVKPHWLGMGTHAHGPHAQETEAEGLAKSLGQPGLQSETL